MNKRENTADNPAGDDAAAQPPAKVRPRLPRLPPAADVLVESTLVSPKGNRFRIVTSREVDASDKS